MKFKFKQIPLKEAKGRVSEICNSEALDINDSVIEEIIKMCKGDMRKIVNMLQSLKLSTSSGFNGDVALDKRRFFEIMGVMPMDVVEQILTITTTKKYTVARQGEFIRM